MKRILQFLTGYIEKTIVESKVWCIEDAFQTDDCFNDVPNEPGIYIMVAKEAKADFNKHSSWNYCRYNYAVAFDADIFYMRITGRENEKALESKAMEGFYDKYGALPVGNGAFSFRK